MDSKICQLCFDACGALVTLFDGQPIFLLWVIVLKLSSVADTGEHPIAGVGGALRPAAYFMATRKAQVLDLHCS